MSILSKLLAPKPEVITKGYMKIGPDYDQGTWRGWRVHAVPADDRTPVTIVKGHDQGDT